MSLDPYEERSVPRVDYLSLEYRLYQLAVACYRYLDANDPKQAALKKLCNDLPYEFEETRFRNHRERN